MRRLLIVLVCLVVSAGPGAAQSPPAPSISHDAFVRAHRPVSTTSPAAQTEFDDGLTLLYAFNPEQARRSFQEAALADPALAMAWWGVAMSYGVNINVPYDSAEANRGHAAILKARALESTTSPVERALIDAAVQRFTYDGRKDADRSATAYRDAMETVAAAYADDDDVQTLAAEAALDVDPWDYYAANGTPTPGTTQIVARLKRVLARNPRHIGANHLLIHALEESLHPQDAVAAADRLARDNFEPAAEHLAHMPAHAYMRVGRYHAAGEANARALDLYRTYLADDPAGHTDYFDHDCVFGVDAFMMSGEYERALDIARSCARGGVGMVPIVDLRFRQWSALRADGASTDFGAAMLAARDGRRADAGKYLTDLRSGTSDVANIQVDVVQARLAQTAGEHDAEIERLRHAVALEDSLGYAEPPAFFYPVRETLGAAYYRAGRYAEADRTFRADLERNMNNPRSLFGLAQTLKREGQTLDAQHVRSRFEAAWKGAAPPDLANM